MVLGKADPLPTCVSTDVWYVAKYTAAFIIHLLNQSCLINSQEDVIAMKDKHKMLIYLKAPPPPAAGVKSPRQALYLIMNRYLMNT